MFEYKVVPAPRKGVKAKGIKTPEDRFSYGLQELMNAEAANGWEFVRAETLPSEERSGFRSTQTVYRSVLIFRQAILQKTAESDLPAAAPVPVAEPEAEPEAYIEPDQPLAEPQTAPESAPDDGYESSNAKA